MALETRYLDDDIIRIPLYQPDADGNPSGNKLKTIVLFWGDQVKIRGQNQGQQVAEFAQREWSEAEGRYKTVKYAGLLPKKTAFRDNSVLKVRFVDVGQGDGAVVESPKGQILFIDGGEEEHIRRYVVVAYSHVLRTKPLNCDAIIVTHGDADHFAGLTELVKGTRTANGDPLVTADRVFHNGLVKVANASGATAFGKTVKSDGKTYAVELENDLTQVDDSRMNKHFLDWKKALLGLKTRDGKKPLIKRLEYGDDSAFDFLEEEGIAVKVLGPITEEVNGKAGLRFLKTPGSSSLSASHTVNGHSIVLKLSYGNVRFLFGADLNEESEESLLERSRTDNVSLGSEVLKVPHHG
ncbi:MAG TPA: MBL fold metallo-hydrolase, partial [Pyrinomonadaceae bacterium]|nr:MBL fold metallo-hydrolase [Pyrinomonadaceae bacterium]